MATLKEFAEYIKKTYPRTKIMLNGKRCDNKLTVDGILYELEEFEKRCVQAKPSSVPQANELSPHVSNCADIEEPYFDKNGKQIKEFAVLKVYHFFGVNEQGRGRKHYYMYKWVRLKEYKGKKYWIAMHLNSDKESNYYDLRAVADKQTRIIADAEIVQQY
jgi:hypothetical protein